MMIKTRRFQTNLGEVLQIWHGPVLIWSDILEEVHADVYDLFIALEHACGT